VLRRTTIWLAGVWSLLLGTAAHALSLGDIEVYSALNQPLEAEIMLTSVRPGETEGMLIRLASEDAFTQAGVDRPFYLTKIKFQLAAKSDGTQYILVTTDNPVREPFLSFLVDIDWPRGHLIREYTVLLDPPVFTSTGLMTPSAPAAGIQQEYADIDVAGEPALIRRDAGEEDGLAELPDIQLFDEAGAASSETALIDTVEPAFGGAPPTEMPPVFAGAFSDGEEMGEDASGDWNARLEQQPLPDIGFAFDETLPYDVSRTEALLAEFGISLAGIGAPRREQGTDSTPDGGDYKVQAGDTLWEIASRHKDPDVSVQQAMLAILRYNPNGFIRNNINDVKKGFVLRIPEREAMLEISRQEATAEAQRQYALWREYRGELVGISSARQDAVAVDRMTQAGGTSRDTGGQLSILAPGRDAQSTSRASGAQEGKEQGGASRLDLQLAREQLEAERLEKVELQSRLTDLTDQIEKMQRLLSLKDDQLAKLQERLRQLEAAAATPAAPAVPKDPQAEAKQDSKPAESRPAADKASSRGQTPAEDKKQPAGRIDTKPDMSVPAPDLAGAVREPGTSTEDPAPDLERLNEPLDLSPQSDRQQPVTVTDAETKKTKLKTKAKPVTEIAPKGAKSFSERLDDILQPVQGFARDLASRLPAPYNKMADDLLSTPAGLGILLGSLILIPVLLIVLLRAAGKAKDKVSRPRKSKPAKVIIGAPDHLETPAAQLATTRFTVKKVSLGERMKKAFAPFAGLLAKKPKPAKASVEEDEAVDHETLAAEEDLATAVQEAAVEVKSKTRPQKAGSDAAHGETVKVKPASAQPVQQGASAPEEEISDDTTAEADVYLAYGLFDQAEELLKHALAGNPGAVHYRGKLLETYFAAGKKDDFEQLAAELHKSIGSRPSRIWDKAVAMGKELAPSNPLFSGATDSGLKASDFAPAKPATADLDLGEAGGATTPDIDFGDVGATETALDLDISGAFDKTVIADDKTMIADDSTLIADDPMIADDSTMLADETSLDNPKPRDITDSELNIDFDADELGLGSELEDADSGGISADSTMAMDIGLDIENIDGITDVDTGSGSFGKSAGDDLIAELGGDDSELSLEGVSSDTEFDLPEDDDTLIDAGDDTVSGDSGAEDEVSTKLDLARAYMDMGDYDGASSTMEEVLSEGNDKQKREAEELLDQIN
jgi:pilus assembly protein FimV